MNARVILLSLLLSSAPFFSSTALAQNVPDVNLELNENQQARVRDIGAKLRCLVCQGESVADSRAPFAFEVKRQIGEFLQQNRTDAEIIGFFQTRYGDTILLEPPRRGINLVLWGVPVIALFGGAALWWSTMKRKNTAQVSAEMLERVDREMLERSMQEPHRTPDSRL